MTMTSAASTLGDSWNRLLGRRQTLDPQPMPFNVKCSPPFRVTTDFPKGKVLLIVDDAIVALDLQRLLKGAGYRVVGPATHVADIQRMIEGGDLNCAILDLAVDRRARLPVADLLAFADVPFVYLTTGVFGDVRWRHRNRPKVEKPLVGKVLLDAVEKAMRKRGQPLLKDEELLECGDIATHGGVGGAPGFVDRLNRNARVRPA